MSFDDVCNNLLGDFPRDIFNYFFNPVSTCGLVYADDYVRFTTWFKSVGGFGQDYRNLKAFHHSLKSENLSLSLKSGGAPQGCELNCKTLAVGTHLLRFSRSHSAALTLEVLSDSQPTELSINAFRVSVHFNGAVDHDDDDRMDVESSLPAITYRLWGKEEVSSSRVWS